MKYTFYSMKFPQDQFEFVYFASFTLDYRFLDTEAPAA